MVFVLNLTMLYQVHLMNDRMVDIEEYGLGHIWHHLSRCLYEVQETDTGEITYGSQPQGRDSKPKPSEYRST